MIFHNGRTQRFAAAALVAGAMAATAQASLVNIFSDADNAEYGIGEFTGSIEYNASSSTAGWLTITITNTSDPDNGGFITGIIFNIDSQDQNATASLTSATHPFQGFTGQSAPPFGGPFDAGAALDGNWSGGGSPADGVAVGATGVFDFDVTANDAMALSASSFISGPLDHNFIVRFRGFDEEDPGSDKVPAIVPAPGVLALLAIGAIAAPGRRRRFAQDSGNDQ